MESYLSAEDKARVEIDKMLEAATDVRSCRP